MTKKINSLSEMAVKLNTAGKGFEVELRKAIAQAVVKVHTDAVRMFGTYQPKVGPFRAWKVLHMYTLREKYKAGAQKDDPLIGHYPPGKKNKVWPVALRNALLMEVRGLVGYVGTNDPLGKIHEFGTFRIPARPFLRPALYKNRKWIRERLKQAIAEALIKNL